MKNINERNTRDVLELFEKNGENIENALVNNKCILIQTPISITGGLFVLDKPIESMIAKHNDLCYASFPVENDTSPGTIVFGGLPKANGLETETKDDIVSRLLEKKASLILAYLDSGKNLDAFIEASTETNMPLIVFIDNRGLEKSSINIFDNAESMKAMCNDAFLAKKESMKTMNDDGYSSIIPGNLPSLFSRIPNVMLGPDFSAETIMVNRFRKLLSFPFFYSADLPSGFSACGMLYQHKEEISLIEKDVINKISNQELTSANIEEINEKVVKIIGEMICEIENRQDLSAEKIIEMKENAKEKINAFTAPYIISDVINGKVKEMRSSFSKSHDSDTLKIK